MRTVLRLLAFLLVFALTALFNAALIDIRFEDIRYLLGTIASTSEVSNTFGIVAKYELIKRRMQFGDEDVNNYELEAKIQALTSGSMKDEEERSAKGKLYRLPVRYLLNGIRFILNKPIINPTEEDKVFSVLEIGYFWERNRRYTEALKIYDEVLGTPHLDPEIRAAILVHKSFCYSMLSRYDRSKRIYEEVINAYPNTEAGILSWKLLDFINSMEKERKAVQTTNLSEMEKAKQFYLLMDFRNAIKNYSILLTENNHTNDVVAEARFYKGRCHEELGENEEALMEYRAVIQKDASKIWARQANRRMLMLGEFYAQQKSIAEEARRQLEAYQDQVFIKNVEKYSAMVSRSTLKGELGKKISVKNKEFARNDSIMKLISQVGNFDLTGEKGALKRRREMEKLRRELIEKGELSEAEILELKRRQYLADNPYRRPSVLKEFIDDNSVELRYIYNKRLRTGIKLSGKMLVTIRIKADGSVSQAKVMQSNMGDSQFEESITKQIKKWKFRSIPDSLGDLTVNYPFEFYEEE